jgi:hypothetical protein
MGDMGGVDMTVVYKRVFVTSTGYPGDLVTAGGGANGIMAADNLCNQAAQAAALGGTFKAWITDALQTTRADIADVGPWALIDRKTIVGNKLNLASTLRHPIDMDEKGNFGVSAPVWTGTKYGGVSGGADCSNWTDSTAKASGIVGQAAASDVNWTQSTTATCNILVRLYCFEQ